MAEGVRRRIAWALALVLLALAAGLVRRAFVLSFFADGEGGAPPPLSQPTGREPGLEPVEHVRVVLIDGLGMDEARALPNLDRMCEGGLDLVVDVGFPTVSLPVQHVLWTGRTQLQSGVLYRIPRLDPPAVDAIPARVKKSLAVAESHPGIVHSFGFSAAQPAFREDVGQELDLTTPWRTTGFLAAAERAVSSDARLALVHVLRVDELGHSTGGASKVYRAGARWADELLARLVSAGRDLPGRTRWFVISDHGHRPGGGHGGSEPLVRKVRACIVGGGLDFLELPRGRELHMVDISRALADSLGLSPAAGAVGRPLAFALAHPDPDATLPRPPAARWLVAAVLLLVALALTSWGASGKVARLPWWVLAAYLSVFVLAGPATLSNPMIYPPLGGKMLLTAIPGILVLAAVAARGARRTSSGRLVAAQLALPVGLCAAALVICGAFSRALELVDQPPLLPLWTAHASLLFSLCAAGAVVVGLVVSVVAGAEGVRTARAGRREAARSVEGG